MKTEQELQELQNEVKSMRNKLSELTEEELEQIAGGKSGDRDYEYNNDTHKELPNS